ncbi:HNH endonuclease [Asticcacaulis sp. EMRT-3]|uniref:HNH endonuclease n=1 Tax=Asticcacaulis sp. EMRT-3 TaxID=3040349 RepID=UPI0024AEFE6D|nr:HNH endonuclease [Asticcacaulis sp. EMRT-3]MDI7775873.1 HNH endonuclease [Asticcacaulis sp. EMRT-3]
MSDDTKELVKQAADQLAKKLNIKSPNLLVGKPKVTETAGSHITVVKTNWPELTIRVWCDKVMDGKSISYWSGFGSINYEPIEKLLSLCGDRIDKPLHRGSNDMEPYGDGKNYRFKKSLTENEMLQAFTEKYPRSCGFGVYNSGDIYDVNRAYNFISNIINLVSTLSIDMESDLFVEEFGVSEGEKIAHKRSEKIKRNSKIIRRKKASTMESYGQLACEVCNFDFRKKYGELGDSFAEVHHLKPIAENTTATITKLDDLAIVCANCHRMLHRKNLLSIDKLKQLISAAEISDTRASS